MSPKIKIVLALGLELDFLWLNISSKPGVSKSFRLERGA